MPNPENPPDSNQNPNPNPNAGKKILGRFGTYELDIFVFAVFSLFVANDMGHGIRTPHLHERLVVHILGLIGLIPAL